ncbi:MAG: hypothetical protein Q9179_001351 [Wetmoreana sp. 5 TL-2023]
MLPHLSLPSERQIFDNSDQTSNDPEVIRLRIREALQAIEYPESLEDPLDSMTSQQLETNITVNLHRNSEDLHQRRIAQQQSQQIAAEQLGARQVPQGTARPLNPQAPGLMPIPHHLLPLLIPQLAYPVPDHFLMGRGSSAPVGRGSLASRGHHGQGQVRRNFRPRGQHPSYHHPHSQAVQYAAPTGHVPRGRGRGRDRGRYPYGPSRGGYLPHPLSQTVFPQQSPPQAGPQPRDTDSGGSQQTPTTTTTPHEQHPPRAGQGE